MKGFQGRWICWAVFSLDNGYLFLKTIEQFICFYFTYVHALLSCSLWTLWVQFQKRPEEGDGRYRAGVTARCEPLVPYKSENSLAHWATSPAPLYLRLAGNWLFLGYSVILLSQPSRAGVTGMHHHSGLSQAVDEICLLHASVNFNWVSSLFSLQFICWQHRRVLGTRSAMPFLEKHHRYQEPVLSGSPCYKKQPLGVIACIG